MTSSIKPAAQHQIDPHAITLKAKQRKNEIVVTMMSCSNMRPKRSLGFQLSQRPRSNGAQYSGMTHIAMNHWSVYQMFRSTGVPKMLMVASGSFGTSPVSNSVL